MEMIPNLGSIVSGGPEVNFKKQTIDILRYGESEKKCGLPKK